MALLAGVVAAFAIGLSTSAQAAPCTECTGWWHLAVSMAPTHLKPGEEGVISVSATNLGNAVIDAKDHPVTISDVLPEGLVPTGKNSDLCAAELAQTGICGKTTFEHEKHGITCEAATVTCTLTESLAPFESAELDISVKAEKPVGTDITVPDTGSVSGGGVAPASITRNLTISEEPVKFGVENYEVEPEDEHGNVESQAGSHPYQLTTTVAFNQILETFPPPNSFRLPMGPEITKNVHVDLPSGLIGNPIGVPQCTEPQFTTHPSANQQIVGCPQNTAIGAAVVRLNEPRVTKVKSFIVPVFNLKPHKGEPARFGFQAFTVPVLLDTGDNGGDFHVVVNVNNASQAASLLLSEVTIWGNPTDPRHDEARGYSCMGQETYLKSVLPGALQPCEEDKEPSRAFLTLPTSCERPLETDVETQSWLPGAPFLAPVSPVFTGEKPGIVQMSGCESLPFSPAISIKPVETQADTPTGVNVLLKVPQSGLNDPEQLAQANIRNTTVKLPTGVELNPSAANGLAACSESAVGYQKMNPHTQIAEFAHENAREESAEEHKAREAAGEICPDASNVGTVRVKTPVLSSELTGNVYIAEQEHNPFGSLFGLYVVVKDANTGVVAKLAGKVELDPETGQITSHFDNAPQLPFEEFELKLTNGPRASVSTPETCGSYTSESLFKPWSVEGEGGFVPSAGPLAEQTFAITSGAGGSACPSPVPFSVGFSAGTVQEQAGAFTPFTLSLTREDGNQAVNGLNVTLPSGIAGMLSNVKQCPEPQASQGTCGPESLIGTATAVSGLGKTPFTVTGGRVYITGPYTPPGKPQAPFGLSVVIPAVAGPFNFGDVVTRSAIRVDPNTAALTIESALPTMVNALHNPNTGEETHTGAPVQLRRVDVRVERPGNAPFQFNPTNCSPMKITGTATGADGGVAHLEQPFQVKGCENLAFSPKLEASTNANYSKVNGTSLFVKVSATPGQANIQSTKIKFPAQLPSRLTTIQKACPEQTFNTNPASCPEGSVIGSAIAHTPVLNEPLQGPAYLVSHGNAAFPDAEFVLQGENGLVLVLDGQTDIKGPNGEPCAQSKTSCVTSSTFNSVPDAPISTFEVTLPAGPHSAFTGYEDLCNPVTTVTRQAIVVKTVGKGKHKHKVKVRHTITEKVASSLQLPTVLGGQNGDKIEETLPLKVTGCKAVASFKKAKAKPKHKKKHKKKKK